MSDVEPTQLVKYLKRHMTYEQLSGCIRDGVPLTGPMGMRRWVAERDVEAFCRLYFPDEFTLDLAPIHREFVADIQEMRRRRLAKAPGLKLARAVPRGHSKSTYYSRMAPIHGLIYGWSPLTILLGNNSTAGERLTKNIKDELDSNERIAEDFAVQRGEVWQSNYLQNSEGMAIRSFGVGSGAVRGVSRPGQRPTLVIGDDLDDDQSVRSPVQLAANQEWFTKAVLPLGDQVAFTTSFVVVGTVIRTTSLMSSILQSPEFQKIIQRGVLRFATRNDLWEEWRTWFIAEAKAGRKPVDSTADEFYQRHREEMLEGTEVLWNRRDAYYTMQLYRLSSGEQAFWSEIMNEPAQAGGTLGHLPRRKVPEDKTDWELVAALDPTTKGGKHNDLAAWVEAWFNRKTKEVIISYVDAKQRPYGQTVEDVANRVARNRYSALWSEGNSSGTIIADSINERLEMRHIWQALTIVNNSAPKDDRIGLLSFYASRGQLFVDPSVDQEFEHEWYGYPSWRFDDVLDAAATIIDQLRRTGMLNLLEQEPLKPTDSAKKLVKEWTAQHGLSAH